MLSQLPRAWLQEVKERENKIELEQKRVEAARLQLAEERRNFKQEQAIDISAKDMPELSGEVVGFAENLMSLLSLNLTAVGPE